jgi:hypothetical protein
MRCSVCGKDEIEVRRMIKSPKYGNICSVCYQRANASPKVFEKPPYGEIGYDPEGKPICHICGRSYKKLISHVIQQHHISQEEYKIQFGLDKGKGIMCEESIQIARKRNKENYEKVVKGNLLEKGKETRFEEGQHNTNDKYFSEQSRRKFISNRYVKPKKHKEE